MSTLYLHVGPHKTGSTSVQAWLARQETALGASQRHLARVAGDVNSTSVVRMFGSVHDAAQFSGYSESSCAKAMAESKLALASGKDVVISGEGLSWLTRRGMRDLVDELSPTEVQLLFALRPVGELGFSTWEQTLRDGSILSFEEWVVHLLENPLEQRRVLPQHKLRALLEGLADSRASRVQLHLVSGPIPVDTSLGVEILCRWLGLTKGDLDHEVVDAQLHRNRGLSNQALVAVFIFNNLAHSQGQCVSINRDSFVAEVRDKWSDLARSLVRLDPEVSDAWCALGLRASLEVSQVAGEYANGRIQVVCDPASAAPSLGSESRPFL